MKSIAGAALVVSGLAVLSLLVPEAIAGEKYLGTILSTDAGSVTNASTGYGSNTFANAFTIPENAKLTVQCDEAAIVAANVRGVDAGNGIALTAAQIFPTSTGAAIYMPTIPDGGKYTAAIIAIAPAVGASAARCRVFERAGTE